jgi:Flp pilus assembly secretin CpaC
MDLTGIVKAAAGAMAVAAMSVVAIPEALAQEPNSVQSRPVQAVTGAIQQITLTMGKGELFETSAPYAKVSVTDEKIAEVTPQSDREFVLNPRGVGSTNVFVLDNKNTLIARLDVNVVGRAAGIQPISATSGATCLGFHRIMTAAQTAIRASLGIGQ